MRIKKYIDSDMTSLINKVKHELGDEAVIISTSSTGDGKIELIAALETPEVLWDDEDNPAENVAEYNDAAIRAKLIEHGVTEQFQSALLSLCRSIGADKNIKDDEDIVTEALNSLLVYDDFWNEAQSVKMFIGPHGSGKTSTLVKVAVSAKMRGISTKIIGTDNVRAGAVGELKAFADILGSEFEFVTGGQRLFDKILAAQSDNQMVLIDTCGINPYLPEDVSCLQRICNVIDCDKILTVDAGYNAEDAVMIAKIFADMGANWFFPTKLDITGKIGSILSAASVGGLHLAYAGVGAKIAGGLATVNSRALARLLMEQA